MACERAGAELLCLRAPQPLPQGLAVDDWLTDDRRFLWAGGLDSSRISIFDVGSDPARPKLVRTMSDMPAKTGYVGPHTFYAMPGRMIVQGLSNTTDGGGVTGMALYSNKGELIAKYPDLAADVFNAFCESKRLYVERLKAGKIEKPTAVDKVHQRVMEVTGEPLPYGIAPNRRVLDELVGHAVKQGIISKPVSVDELFAPSTRALVG